MSIFAQPAAFALFLVLPALWLLARHARQERATALARFGDPALLARSSFLPGRGSRVRSALRWLALAAAVLALARPQIGRQPKPLARTGRDIIVALDLSRSMKVADVGGTRLRAAKRLAWQLASARPGDRIGLVVFGGAGFLALPPTGDLATFQLFLDAASPDDIGDPASDIAAGLRVAERALRREGTAIGSRAILLVTDGERNEGPIAPAIEALVKSQLPVFAVGVGTAAGGLIPNDSGAAEGPWHLDGIGRQIISRLNEGGLDSLATATGGAYARYDDPRALEQMTSALQNLEARVLASQPATEPQERYQWPLFVAVLCLLADLLLGARRPSAARPAGAGARRTGVPARGSRPPSLPWAWPSGSRSSPAAPPSDSWRGGSSFTSRASTSNPTRPIRRSCGNRADRTCGTTRAMPCTGCASTTRRPRRGAMRSTAPPRSCGRRPTSTWGTPSSGRTRTPTR